MKTNGGQDSDALMRSEIHQLGVLLGHSLTRQEGPQLFELVEKIRTLSKDKPKIVEAIERVFKDNKELLEKLGSDYDENGVPYWEHYEERLKYMEENGI